MVYGKPYLLLNPQQIPRLKKYPIQRYGEAVFVAETIAIHLDVPAIVKKNGPWETK